MNHSLGGMTGIRPALGLAKVLTMWIGSGFPSWQPTARRPTCCIRVVVPLARIPHPCRYGVNRAQ